MIEPVVIQDARTGEVKLWAGEDAHSYAEWRIEEDACKTREEDFDLRAGPSPGRPPAKPEPTSTLTRSEALLLAAKLLVGPEGHPGPMGPMGMQGAPT